MASIKVGPCTVTLDVHGYKPDKAIRTVLSILEDAHLNGFTQVTVIHGARDVRHAPLSGRGGIKWQLREMLDAGRFDQWVERGTPTYDPNDLADSLLAVIHEKPSADGVDIQFWLRKPVSPRQPNIWRPIPEDDFKVKTV